jgi:hypothetical protein
LLSLIAPSILPGYPTTSPETLLGRCLLGAFSVARNDVARIVASWHAEPWQVSCQNHTPVTPQSSPVAINTNSQLPASSISHPFVYFTLNCNHWEISKQRSSTNIQHAPIHLSQSLPCSSRARSSSLRGLPHRRQCRGLWHGRWYCRIDRFGP